jgi:2-dehydro-3-deoxyphosphogluconate aldolase/(4S)-4-hydroxy-2-oxoglutarate aldolase
MADVLTRLREMKVVPVIVIDDAVHAVPLAAALVKGGLRCAEVTFRTPAAAESIRRMVDAFPDMLVGAGTVLTPAQATQAHEAGASFIVSPGSNPRVVDHALEREIPIFPGVCTPTEIEAVLERGLRVAKYFPAEPMGGLPFLRAVSAPYGDLEFIPTGGIDATHLPGYLGFGRVVACGGSWMAPAVWIREQAFDRIVEETRKVVGTVREITQKGRCP